MSLKGDDEFIVIHVDENSEVSDTTEYVQMKIIKNSSFEYDKKSSDESTEKNAMNLIEKVIDDVIDEIVTDITTKNIPIITKQPTKTNTESQTNITYSIHETNQEQDNVNLDAPEYENIIDEEEPCLYHYKPTKKYRYRNRHRNRNRKTPCNKRDCLGGFTRFIKYIFNL